MNQFEQRIKQIKQDIRDLKTVQLTQSNSEASVAFGHIPQFVPAGSNIWTIQFVAAEDESEPLTDVPNTSYYQLAVLKFDQEKKKKKIQMFLREDWQRSTAESFLIVSSRPIESVTRNF